jgi:hypothetical protein
MSASSLIDTMQEAAARQVSLSVVALIGRQARRRSGIGAKERRDAGAQRKGTDRYHCDCAITLVCDMVFQREKLHGATPRV